MTQTAPREPGRGLDPATASIISDAVRGLPPLPGSIHDLLALNIKDPQLPESLQEVVSRDPVLAAHVIRIANSSAYRGQSAVDTLAAGIQRVGAPMIVGYFLQSTIHGLFDPYQGLGRHLGHVAALEANLMGALARAMDGRIGISPELAYLHGLLHDLGHLVMAAKFGPALEALDHRRIPADLVARRETETFGFDHQVAGRILAKHWRLPEDFTVVIASHHFPREYRVGHQDATNTVIDLLALADRLGRVAEEHEQRTRAEEAVAAWLVTTAAAGLLRPLAMSADAALTAFMVALAGLEREQRMIGSWTASP